MKKVDDDKVFWARDNKTVKIPTKREEDAGWDIYANFEEDMWVIQPHTTVMIPTNLRSAFSPKWVAILKERGSTGTKGIAQRCGVIDSGFRNAWMIPITNTTNKPIVILKKGVDIEGLDEVVIYPYEKAIAQAIFVEVPKLQSEEISVEELLNIKSERGEGMLGSSKK